MNKPMKFGKELKKTPTLTITLYEIEKIIKIVLN